MAHGSLRRDVGARARSEKHFNSHASLLFVVNFWKTGASCLVSWTLASAGVNNWGRCHTGQPAENLL